MNEELIQLIPAGAPSFLTSLHLWGLDIVRAVQGAGNPGFELVMRFASVLGSELFILPLLLLIFWCVDEKRGFRLGLLVILSAWINVFLKALLKQPRPFNLDPQVGLSFESSFGFPSGHAQSSLTLLLPLASWAAARFGRKKGAKKLIWAAAVFLVLLIGLSRIYLGVHFPTDLAGGWITAGCILALFYFASPRAEALLKAGGKRSRLIFSASAALIMNGLHPEDPSLPALLLGFAGGYSLAISSPAAFSAQGLLKGKKPGFGILAARYIVGAAGAGVIYFALRLILPGENSIFAEHSFWGSSSSFLPLGRFIRYALLGLWVSAGAPRVFGNFGLAAMDETEFKTEPDRGQK